jgi:hypothetical protein
MANMATETSADHKTVATLTNEIYTLTDKLAAKYMWAKSQEAELKRLMGGHASTATIVTAAPGGPYIRKSYKTKNDN